MRIKSFITYTIFVILLLILIISVYYNVEKFLNNKSKETYSEIDTNNSGRIITKECASITPTANGKFSACIIEIDSTEYIFSTDGGIFPILPKIKNNTKNSRIKK